MPPNQETKTYFRHRSAITGRFVTEDYARRHPDTTVKETYKVKIKKKAK